MPVIGFVTKQQNGSFQGRLQTLSVNAPLTITPRDKDPESRQPDYTVKAGPVELGGGWVRMSQRGEEYVSLSIAAPEFGRLYANLVQSAEDPNHYALLWNPPADR